MALKESNKINGKVKFIYCKYKFLTLTLYTECYALLSLSHIFIMPALHGTVTLKKKVQII